MVAISKDIPTELITPGEVEVPSSIDAVVAKLDGVTGLLTAGQWGTAAIVWAYTEEGTRGPESKYRSVDSNGKDFPKLSLTDFAKLGIRGLSTRPSIRKYRGRWQEAIDDGIATETAPGQRVRLPEQDFKTDSKAHVTNNSGEVEWYTPKEFVEAAREVMGGIDLDPASNAEANEVVGASKFYTPDDDGLSHEWSGRVWMNPPYSNRAVSSFCEKLVESYRAGNVPQACVLVNNATDTRWFQLMAKHASAICFPAGRVRFWNPERKADAPLQGQAILYFGDEYDQFLSRFSTFGFCLEVKV